MFIRVSSTQSTIFSYILWSHCKHYYQVSFFECILIAHLIEEERRGENAGTFSAFQLLSDIKIDLNKIKVDIK